MQLFQRLSTLVLIGLLVAACSTSEVAKVPYASSTTSELNVQLPSTEFGRAYRIEPRDELDIVVFRVEDLSGEYQTGLDGSVDMPLIGPMRVAGLTASEAARMLESQYGAQYLESPSIQVSIKKKREDKVVVEGAVNRPGAYELEGRTTLLEAIAMASGLDLETANTKRLLVIREIDGQPKRVAFDINKVRAGLMPNPRIYDGDIVIVDGSTLRGDLLDLLRAAPLVSILTR